MFNKETPLLAFLFQEPMLRTLLAEQWKKHPCRIEKYEHQPILQVENYNNSKRVYIRDPYTSQIITYMEQSSSRLLFWKKAWAIFLDPEDEEWQYFWEYMTKTLIQEIKTTNIQNVTYHENFFTHMLVSPLEEWREHLLMLHDFSLELQDFGINNMSDKHQEMDIII